MIIDGIKISRKIIRELKTFPAPLKTLSVILAGDNAASLSFIRKKTEMAHELGIKIRSYNFFNEAPETALQQLIESLNNDRTVGGIVVQLPLPRNINRERVISLINPEKDVDAFKAKKILPPTTGAVRDILSEIKFKLKSSKAVVVGKGLLVGAPVAAWLKGKTAKLVVTDKDNLDKKELKNADLIITGVGKAGIIKGKFLKRNAVIIDFGYSVKDGKIRGDLALKPQEEKNFTFTPTPRGTGPIVIAELLKNFFYLTKG